jgi:hypothetical protein
MKASISATVFVKKLGYHRDAPRLYFQTMNLNEYGFTPGARYDAELFAGGSREALEYRIELRLHPEGRRAVCKKKVGDRVLSIIDINGKQLMEPFRNYERVSVSVTKGLITITPVEEV